MAIEMKSDSGGVCHSLISWEYYLQEVSYLLLWFGYGLSSLQAGGLALCHDVERWESFGIWSSEDSLG